MGYPTTKDKSFPLYGGLDLVSDMSQKEPGSLIAGKNIQIISGKNGYYRSDGIERCTNDTLSSNAIPIYLLVANNTATISIGDVGTYAGGTAVCLADVSGSGEKVVPVVCSNQADDMSSTLSVSFTGGTISIDSIVTPETYFTNSEIGTIRSHAKDSFLTFIPAVTGSGVNSGGFRLRGVNYVFRNGGLYKGGDLSWSLVDMPDIMYFESGVSELSVGDTITDGAETADIASITRQTGSWNHTLAESEQSAGYLTLTNVTGGFTLGHAFVVNGSTVPVVGAFTDDGIDTFSQPYVLSDNDVVELTIVLTGITTGTITPQLNDGVGLPDEGDTLSTNGTHVVLIAATKDITTLELVYSSDFDGTLGIVVADVGRRAIVSTVNETYELPVGGSYKTDVYNFTNLDDNDSMFGVSGVGPAFEFDGTSYIPIYHPDTEKFPNNLMIHQDRLHLCFPGGEKPYSISGSPRIFNSLLGAGTHSTGSEITGCTSVHGNAALVFCERDRWFLIGDGIYDDESATRNWQFFRAVKGAGCEENTLVSGDKVLFISGGSVYALVSTDTTAGYGFDDVSEMFSPTMVDQIGKSVCSVWIKSKSQYLVFFENGAGVCISFRSGSIIGATPIELPVSISNIWKSIEGGGEHIFFTATDSDYLYKMDSGDSMDGDYISGSLRIPFHSYGYPRNEKEYPQVVIGLSAPVKISDDTTIKYTVNFDYGSVLSPLPIVQTAADMESAGGVYGSNDGFGNFVWGGAVVSEIFAYIDGYGANMSLLITFKTKNDLTFGFQTVSVDCIVHGKKGRG